MQNLTILTVLFDLLLALLSIWVLFKLIGYGGLVGRSLSQVGYGIIIIGFSQILETIWVIFINTNLFDIEIFHRLILVIGFFLVALGFKNLMEKKQSPPPTNQ